MSMRSELRPYKVITDGNLSLAAVNSLVTVVQKISLVTYTYSWTGTSPVGTLKVQVSNEYALDPTGNVLNAGGDWSDLPFTAGSGVVTTVALSGNTGAANITIPLCGAYAVRTVFTRTSGVGTLQAWICGKVS